MALNGKFYLQNMSGYYADQGAQGTDSNTVYYYITASATKTVKTIEWTLGGSGEQSYLQTTIGNTLYYLNIHNGNYQAILWPVNSNDSKISADFTTTTKPNIKHTAKTRYLDVNESNKLCWKVASEATESWQQISASSAYTWTFDLNGGSLDILFPSSTSPELTLPDTEPTKPNATFLGWSLNGNTTKLYVRGETVTTTVGTYNNILRAEWKDSTQYTITYNANGGSFNSGYGGKIQPATLHKFVYLWPSSAVTRPYHRFMGWNTEQDGSGTFYAGGLYIPSYTLGDITLYAIWKTTLFTIQINLPNYTVKTTDSILRNFEKVYSEKVLTVSLDDDTVLSPLTSSGSYGANSGQQRYWRIQYDLFDVDPIKKININFQASVGEYLSAFTTDSASNHTINYYLDELDIDQYDIHTWADPRLPAKFQLQGIPVSMIKNSETLVLYVRYDYWYRPYVNCYTYYGEFLSKRHFGKITSIPNVFDTTTTISGIFTEWPEQISTEADDHPAVSVFNGWNTSKLQKTANVSSSSFQSSIDVIGIASASPGDVYVGSIYEAWMPNGFSIFIDSLSFQKDGENIDNGVVSFDPPIQLDFGFNPTAQSSDFNYAAHIPTNLNTVKPYYYFTKKWYCKTDDENDCFTYAYDVLDKDKPTKLLVGDHLTQDNTLKITVIPKTDQANFTISIMLNAKYDPRIWKAIISYDKNGKKTTDFPTESSSKSYTYNSKAKPSLETDGYVVNTNDGSCTLRVALSDITPIADNTNSNTFYTFSSWRDKNGSYVNLLPDDIIEITVPKDETKNPSEKSITLYAQWIEGGIVYIFDGGSWKKAIPYIYAPNGDTDTKPWKITQPYIYQNGLWKPTTS